MTAHDQVLEAEQLLANAGEAYARRNRDDYVKGAELRDALKSAAMNYCLALERFAADYRRNHNTPTSPNRGNH